MKIKTKLQISSLSTLFVALALGLVLFGSAVKTNQAYEEGKRVVEINQKITQIKQISEHYFDKAQSKQELEWYAVFNQISKLVGADFSQQKNQIMIENLRQNQEDIQAIFLQYKLEKNNKQKYKGILLEKIDKLQNLSTELNYSLQSQIGEYEATSKSIIFLSIGIIIIMIGSFSFLFRRNIAEPVNELYEGTIKIADGDLNYKLDFKREDEIGKLANSFDEMTSKLKDLYTNLEQKIQERTNQIYKKMEEIKKTKRNLEKEKSQGDAILSSLAEGMVVVNGSGKIVFVNEPLLTLLDQQKQELINGNIYQCCRLAKESGKELNKAESPVYLGLTKGEKLIDNKDYHLVTKTNKRLEVSITVSPVVVKSKIIGAILSIRDITKEKEVQRLKDEFLSFAAHQLRTPLGSMRWNLEIMLAEPKENVPAKHLEKLQEMYESNVRIIHLINELLDVSAIDEGVYKDSPVATDVVSIIKNQIKEMQNFASMRQVTISMENPAFGVPKAVVDPKNFNEVIDNLLSNAVKYNKTGGKVKIKFNIKEKKLLITIEDTGIGIPENDQKLVFTKFFRAHNAILQQTEGTGLGLFMVKYYVERWGGKIWLESEENKFTKYFLELKIND